METASAEYRHQDNREHIQRMFQNLHTVVPVVIGTIEAGISEITNDTAQKSQKRLKTGEESMTTTMNTENSATTLEKEPEHKTKSISSNYNPAKKKL